MLRFFLLVAVAQAVKDLKNKGVQGENSAESVPEGLESPEELVQWALARAAERLNDSSVISDSGGFFPSIFVAWEQPRIEGWQFKGEDRLFGEL